MSDFAKDTDVLISRQAAIETLLLYRHSVLSAEEIISLIPSVQERRKERTMRLIDADALYESTAEWEASAFAKIEELNRTPLEEMTDEERAEWRIWTAILNERSAFKHDVFDAPTIDVHDRKVGKWTERKVIEDSNAIEEWQSARCSVCGKIHTTPRYIDAEKLEKDGWSASRTYRQDEKTMVYETKKMTDFPTADVVEVVRCKDCKHYWKNWKNDEPDDNCDVCLASPKDDAFCSEGERREDE